MRFWRPRKKTPTNGQRRTLPFEEPRWSLTHPLAVLRVDGHNHRHTLLGYAENISRDGMMIGAVWPKEVGSRHQIEFALPRPADLVVRCCCEVVWARTYAAEPHKPGMGLRFLELPESTADVIDALWRNGQALDAPACRIWSEFDKAWIAWTPRTAAPKGLSA